MSQDQKPYNDEEQKRIQNAGGFVKNNKVLGKVDFSRALGCFEYKKNKDLPV